MERKPEAVGIYNKEIFIANFNKDGNITNFDVLRHVDAEELDDLRDPDSYKEYCRDLWVEAVRAGQTESSLLEFAQELINEADVDNDEEAFPLKDESSLQYLTQEERKVADNFLLEEYGIEVGTWECSGAYDPGSFDNEDFKKFDLVFDFELAEQYYKTLK